MPACMSGTKASPLRVQTALFQSIPAQSGCWPKISAMGPAMKCAKGRSGGNGNIYVLSQDNQLYALSQADGKISWKIGRAHVCTPVTNAHLVCRHLREKKKNPTR